MEYVYLDGIAILYRINEGSSTSFYIGYIKGNQLMWSQPVQNVDVYRMNVYSKYIVAVQFESDAGYVIYLYDEDGNIVKRENLRSYHIGSISGVTVRGGKDYLYMTIQVPTDNGTKSALYLFSDEYYEYHIYIDESEHGVIEVEDETAQNEEMVEIQVIPDEGYAVQSIRMRDDSGKVVEISASKFRMPKSDVVITSTISFNSVPIFLSGLIDNAILSNSHNILSSSVNISHAHTIFFLSL